MPQTTLGLNSDLNSVWCGLFQLYGPGQGPLVIPGPQPSFCLCRDGLHEMLLKIASLDVGTLAEK